MAFRPVLPRASVRGLAFLALVPLLAALSAGCERRDVPQLVTVTVLLPTYPIL